MNSWPHKHILTLANFSKEDFKVVIDLSHKFELRNKSKKNAKFDGILNLKFLFLIITFLTFFCLIFLSSDCLTISTSGNSGI